MADPLITLTPDFGTPSPYVAALKGVKDPDIQRDLVDLGMIKNIRIGGGNCVMRRLVVHRRLVLLCPR